MRAARRQSKSKARLFAAFESQLKKLERWSFPKIPLWDWEQTAIQPTFICNSDSPYCLSSWLPHGQLNTISHYYLAIQVIHLLFLSFHWLSSTCSCYLHSDNSHWMFGILLSLIDFYLIIFRTYMNISPTFLSLLFTRSWCLFSTYSYFSFNILLRGSIYYKNLHTTLE